MNIKKILKFYLVLTLSITAMSLLSYSDMIRNNASHYYANALNTLDQFFDDSDYKYSEAKTGLYALNNNSEILRKDFKNDSEGFSFSINNIPGKAYALPESKMAEIMNLNFKTKEKSLEIKSISFKIEGVAPENIVAAYLFNKEKVLSTAKNGNGSLFFDGMNYEIAPNSSEVLTVKLDLGSNLKPGNRIRLDIVAPEDLVMELENESIDFDGSYPIKGKYLSIHRQRLE